MFDCFTAAHQQSKNQLKKGNKSKGKINEQTHTQNRKNNMKKKKKPSIYSTLFEQKKSAKTNASNKHQPTIEAIVPRILFSNANNAQQFSNQCNNAAFISM